MTDDLYAHYAPTVSAVARSVGKTYRAYTSFEDIEQELWITVYGAPDHFRRYMAAPEAANAALGRAAHKYCEKQRTALLGASEPTYDLYSPKAVRLLLEDAFNYEDWQSFASKGDTQPRAKRIEATSDRIAMLIDVKVATDKLPEREYSIIIGRFKYRYDDDQMADMLEVSPVSVRKLVERAVKALTDLLNPSPEAREYVERRKVKSNAAARAEVSHSWDG